MDQAMLLPKGLPLSWHGSYAHPATSLSVTRGGSMFVTDWRGVSTEEQCRLFSRYFLFVSALQGHGIAHRV